MEKLVIAVVHKKFKRKLKDALLSANFRLTQLESEGGFLGERNATFMIGAKSDEVEKVLGLIRETCKRKNIYVSDMPANETGEMRADFPIGGDPAQIEVGGATVFIVPVEKSEKI